MLSIKEELVKFYVCSGCIDKELGSGYYIVTSEIVRMKPIQRICKADPERILYIGSGKLKSRLRGFKKVICDKSERGHAGAVTYNRRRNEYKKEFPPKSLFIYYNICGDALEKEACLQKEYEKEYGELPPLNLSRAIRSDEYCNDSRNSNLK